ncbi:prohead core scaffold protein [Aeromonas phage AS-zj]|uniref:Prohead core scaffold protein n=1 Tax=Aeromonas phage AS-zj TaxID=2024208 RepID=A0A223LD68_9CAUD|nr:head scaffolding protein [Aeromonas phage AS-zj]ASU00167.1 prohead core scaffold protein [Aeromonas phage AS-zj]
MSIKDQLLSESKNITVQVDAISGALQGLNLSEGVVDALTQVFQTKLREEAVQLAESHIEALAAKSDELVQEAAEAKNAELIKTMDSYFEHLAESFMEDNKVAIETGIQAQLAESLLAGMKELFVSHHVVVPEDAVDIVAEQAAELEEAQSMINDLVSKNSALTESIQAKEREAVIAESIKDLTMVQQEQVKTLCEGISFGSAEQFGTRVSALVEMVSQKKDVDPAQKPLNENLNFNDDEGQKDDKDEKGEKGEKGKKDKKPEPKSKIDESVQEFMHW